MGAEQTTKGLWLKLDDKKGAQQATEIVGADEVGEMNFELPIAPCGRTSL